MYSLHMGIKYNNLVSEDGELPPPSREEQLNDLTLDVPEEGGDLLNRIGQEIGGQGILGGRIGGPGGVSELGSTSPVKAVEPRKEVQKKRKETTPAGKETPKKTRKTDKEEAEDTRKNSDFYPKDQRPPMFENDEKFNKLSFDKAAKICFSFYQMEEKKKEKESKDNTVEKTDDKIPTVEIPAGPDNAGDILNIEAREKLRPVNKEMGDIMDWYVYKRKEIVRNIPLNLYGLQDSVSSKAIESCHNLSSTIEIKMFSPNNLRSATTSQRQKAFTDREGKLVVEADDVYGELETTWEVMLAWNTLDSVWSKIHPIWPVARIGIRVCIMMKHFAHCGSKAREVMVVFSNRYLASNARNVANRKGPMSAEKAWTLAGSVCANAGFSREPGARPSKPEVQAASQSSGGSLGGSWGAGGRGGGGRGGHGAGGRGRDSRGGGRPNTGRRLQDGTVLCHFYNSSSCRTQGDECLRQGIPNKHLCGFLKSSGVCGMKHSKMEHDVAKHGQ